MKARIIREPRCALLWRIDETYPNYAAITRAAKRYDVKLRAVADGDLGGIVGDLCAGKPAPAFAIFLGGSDALGHAHFGDTIGTVYEEQLPALLVELGQAAAAAGQNWQTWSAADPDAVNSIIAKYV